MHEQQRPGLVDLMASVGFLLLRWGVLEQGLHRTVQALGGNPQGELFGEVLSLWRDLQRDDLDRVRRIEMELKPVQKLRNLVAHGINGASADYAKHSEPVLFCISKDGDKVRVALSELQGAIRTLERLGGNFALPPSDSGAHA